MVLISYSSCLLRSCLFGVNLRFPEDVIPLLHFPFVFVAACPLPQHSFTFFFCVVERDSHAPTIITVILSVEQHILGLLLSSKILPPT